MTTAFVTSMSGCCCLASWIAMASAWKQKGCFPSGREVELWRLWSFPPDLMLVHVVVPRDYDPFFDSGLWIASFHRLDNVKTENSFNISVIVNNLNLFASNRKDLECLSRLEQTKASFHHHRMTGAAWNPAALQGVAMETVTLVTCVVVAEVTASAVMVSGDTTDSLPWVPAFTCSAATQNTEISAVTQVKARKLEQKKRGWGENKVILSIVKLQDKTTRETMLQFCTTVKIQGNCLQTKAGSP